jgi:hypothetical protein
LCEPKYIGDVGELCPVVDTEVEVVCVCRAGEFGLRRGAEDDEEDNPRRAKSTLKLDRRESGGKGEELLRLLCWKLITAFAKGSALSFVGAGCLWKTVGSVIARCPLDEVCEDVMRLLGIDAPGADE